MQYYIEPYNAAPHPAPLSAVASGVPVNVPADRLSQYTSLQQQLRSAQTVPQRLKAAEAELKSATNDVKEGEAAVARCTAQLEKDEVKSGKAEKGPLGGPLKKMLMPGKVEERVKEMDTRVAKDTQDLAAAVEALEVARKVQATAAAAAAGLRSENGTLSTAKKAEAQLVESLFAANSPFADATEMQLRGECDALKPKVAQMRHYTEHYTRATGHIERAAQEMVESAKCFKRALMMSTMDMIEDFDRRPFQRGPDLRSVMNARMETAMARKGAALYQSGANNIQDATRLCPDVPQLDMAMISATVNTFATVVFDNIMTDMIVRRRIQAALDTIEVMAGKVRNALQWMQTTLSTRIAPDLAKLEAQEVEAIGKLNKHRRRLLDMAAANLGRPQQQQQQAGPAPAPGSWAPAPPPPGPAGPTWQQAPPQQGPQGGPAQWQPFPPAPPGPPGQAAPAGAPWQPTPAPRQPPPGAPAPGGAPAAYANPPQYAASSNPFQAPAPYPGPPGGGAAHSSNPFAPAPAGGGVPQQQQQPPPSMYKPGANASNRRVSAPGGPPASGTANLIDF